LPQKLYLFFLLFTGYCAVPLQSNSQAFPNLNFRSITEADRLSAKYVTNIVQDKRGLIWIGTNNGLNRYDGSRIINFYANNKDSNALQSSSIGLMRNDSNNIWINTTNGFSSLNPFTSEYKNYKMNGCFPFFSEDTKLFFANDGVYEETNGVLKKDEGWGFETFSYYGNIITRYQIVVADKNGVVWAATNNRLYRLDMQTKKPVQTIILSQTINISNIFFDSENNGWLGTYGNGLFKLNTSDATIKHLDFFKKTDIIYDIKEWVFNKKKYLVVCADAHFGLMLLDPVTLEFQSYLGVYGNTKNTEAVQVTNAFIDKDNNLWLSTTNGVRLVSAYNSLFRVIPVEAPHLTTGDVYQLKEEASGYWLSKRYGGGIFHYNKNWELINSWQKFLPDSKNKFVSFAATTEAYDFKQVKNTLYITTEIGMALLNLINNNTSVIYTNEKLHPRLRTIVPVSDSAWMIRSFNHGVFIFNPVTNAFTKQYLVYKNNSSEIQTLNYLLKTPTGIILASTSQGLLYYNLQQDKFLPFEVEGLLSLNHYGMACDKKGIVWIGTDNGLIAINPQTKKIVKKFDEYPEMGQVGRVAIDKDDNIWFNCQKGYWCWMQQSLKMIKFTYNLGLPDNKPEGGFNSTPNGDIYGGGFNAVVKFNPEELKNYGVAAKALITEVKANGIVANNIFTTTDTAHKLVLKPQQNNIDIYFSVTDYAQPDNYGFYYKILPDNKEWIKTEQGHISFNRLAYGKYTILVKGQNNITSEYTSTDILYLTIQPKWRQTWGFKLLALLTTAALFYAFYKIRTRQIKKAALLKSGYENKMLHLEMQNLRSQMNPHFLFNSLNSINSFIVENKTHLASDYLTKFSRLMRLILENSKNESITLEKEIETLRLYLLMESIRFDKKFDYTIYVEPGIDEQIIKVPPMIVQPYAENAIWHGLLHKKEKGKVTIGIKKTNDALRIIIEDNGIGRGKAAEMKSKNSTSSKSYGMQITEQRIKQLNNKNTIDTTDLKDENENACGTRVELSIFFK
jgi:ligand-binding sensor domain-containing protein/anti-sigma regulatory factor (Ser/Thr protein kinase)